MPTLSATGSALSGVRPELNELGEIINLHVDIALRYANEDQSIVTGMTVTFNAWDVLDETQKTNMQDIQSTLMSYIITTYF